MKKVCCWAIVVAAALTSQAAAVEEFHFTYQGRVRSGGTAFEGTGQFKFAIFTGVDPDENILWNSDGDVTLDVPSTAVSISVNNGFFSVDLGDTSLTNMASLNPTIFLGEGKMFLRVWFSDGASGFQQLSPDRRLHNYKARWGRQIDAVDLFVNASTGNDEWAGITAARPKKTIMAAVNALPEVITKGVVIRVAAGVYLEQVNVTNLALSGPGAALTFLGNTTTPSNVRVSGATSLADTTPARPHGFVLNQSAGVSIQGFQVDYCSSVGIAATDSSLSVADCIFSNDDIGCAIYKNSNLTMTDCTISDERSGVYVTEQSNCTITDCVFNNLGHAAVNLHDQSRGVVTDCTFQTCGQGAICTQLCSLKVTGSTFDDITVFNATAAVDNSYLLLENRQIEGVQRCGAGAFRNSFISIKNSTIDKCRKAGGDAWAVTADDGSHVKIYPPTSITGSLLNGAVLARRNSYVEFYHIGGVTTISGNPAGLRAERSSSIDDTNGSSLNLSDTYSKDSSSYLHDIP
jgi:parallel beta-helix repeat protein